MSELVEAPSKLWSDQDYLSAEEILLRVRTLGPLIEEEAPKVRAAGCLTERLKEAFRDSGVFRIGFPAAWGGPEMRLDDQIRLVEFVSQFDASIGWNVMILVDGGIYAAILGDPLVARDIYPSMDLATSATSYPPGRAEAVQGGYRLTGRWAFGSGIRNADRSVCGFLRYGTDGQVELGPSRQPQMFDVWVPREALTVHDTWYTTGLEGSGSAEFSISGDVVVPAEHMIARSTNPRADGLPFARVPWLLEATQIGVSLGMAKHALDAFGAFIAAPSNKSTAPIKTHPAVVAALAEGQANYRAARAMALTTYSEVSDVLRDGGLPTQEQCGSMLASLVIGARLCRESIEVLIEAAGSRTVLSTNAFDQIYRDMSTAIRHPLHRRAMFEQAGSHYLNHLDTHPAASAKR